MAVGTNRAKHSAPGPYLGYGLQPIRMCYLLLTEPHDCSVSLEHADDVAVHYADGSTLLEQTKSALGQNPLSNWSKELWKALSNWLDVIQSLESASPPIQFRLYVVPQHTGDFAQAMNVASSRREVKELVEQVSSTLAALDRKPVCHHDVEKFLNSTKDQQVRLICNFRIESDVADPVQKLRGLFEHAVPSAALDRICAYAIGLAKQKAETLMRAGRPPWCN
jgi:hypothetical protein